MVCALSPSQEARLLKKVSKDLLEAMASNTPFDLNSYITNIHDQVKKSTGKDDLALTYAALIPKTLKVIFGADPAIDEYLENSIGEIQKRSKEFLDFDNVIKFIVPDAKEELKKEQIIKKIELEQEAEKNEEKERPVVYGVQDFSELPNSLTTTVGNPDNPVYKFSYSFLRHHAAEGNVDSSISNIYLAFGKAVDLLPEAIFKQLDGAVKYVHILSDFDGNILYFNDNFEQVSMEEGLPVFFTERNKLSQIQSREELAAAYGFYSDKEIDDFINAQKQEIFDKRAYVDSEPGRRIIQNIIGANHSYTKTKETKTNLSIVEDLSMYPLKIQQDGKKSKQSYMFDRGPYMMPIKFGMKSLKTNMEFVDIAADILLGNVVDEKGNNLPLKLFGPRKMFFQVFLANNSRLKFKDGVVYVDNKVVTTKEELIPAMLSKKIQDKRTGNEIEVDNVFQVYKSTLSEVPFYKVVDGQIRLFSNGMSGVEYRKFIQENAYTFMEVTPEGKFKEYGGYYIFAQGLYRQVDGEVVQDVNLGEDPTNEQESGNNPEIITSISYEQYEKNLDSLLKDSLEALDKANSKSTKYILGFHGGRNFEKPDRAKQYTGEFRNPDAKRIAESSGARYEGQMLFFTKDNYDELIDYNFAIKAASRYALMYGDNNPTVYAYLIPIKEADFTDRGAGEVGLSYDAIEKGLYKEVGRTQFTRNFINQTDTEEEDFNFAKSKDIDLGNVLGQFDKLKDQKLINQGVTKEQLDLAKAWYESSPLSKHISLTTLFNVVNSSNSKSIATFNAMGITLYKGSDYSDLYHEAWHAFTQQFLTSEERASLYKDVRKRKGTFIDFLGNTVNYSEANDRQVEEVLAEEFRSFMLSGGKTVPNETPKKKSIFQKILDLLKLLFNINSEDILAQHQSSNLVNEMFDKLRLGNIRTSPLGLDNSAFTNLDKIKALTPEQQAFADEIGYENSIKIVNLIDGLFSEFIDEKVNKGRGINYTVAILSKPETRSIAYNYALSRIKDKVKELTSQIKKTDAADPQLVELKKKRALLVFAIRNFAEGSTNGEDISGSTLVSISNINNTPTGKASGIVAYHMEKSNFLSFEDRYELLEASGEERSKLDSQANPEEENNTLLNSRDGYSHKAGNEVSMKELASNEVLYLIRSLFAYDKGKVIVDEFGFPKLGNFDENWNKIQKLVGGINNAEEMHKKMLTSADPVIKQLVSKLGDPRVGSEPGVKLSENKLLQSNLWTRFFEVFSAKRIPLVQLTIDISTSTGDVTVKPGRAQAEIDKISRDWDAQFTNPKNPNRFVITKSKLTGKARDNFKTNYLDINAVYLEYKDKYKSDPVGFLRSLGMLVSNEPEIVQALKTNLKVFPESMMNIIKDIRNKQALVPDNPFKLTKPSMLVNFEVEEGVRETSAYKELLTLESRYSEKYGTAMVSNAKGDAQYELSLRSTGANMVDYFNSAPSFAALVANPSMNHLSVERNPFVDKLMLIRETFGNLKDPKNPGKRLGEETEVGRKKTTKLNLENSSGISVTIDNEFSELGIKSAETDDTAQMLQQFYTMSLYGVSEATKHSDKASVFFFRPIFASGKKHYIPSYKFAAYSELANLEEEKNLTDGTITAVNQFVNYLAGEVERIYKLQNGDSSGNAIVGSKTYKEVGSDFIIFEDILTPETIDLIKSKGIVSDFLSFINEPENSSLLEKIQEDISNYLTTQVDTFKRDAERVGLTKNDKLMSQVRKAIIADSALANILTKSKNKEFLDEAVFRNYVINQLIHTMEISLLFYGDIALYNLQKEEFHKRNAGIAATGNFMRIDSAMLQILNSAGANYSNSKWYDKELYGDAEPKVFTRTANTAVLQDADSSSVYYDEYVEALIDHEKTIRGVDTLPEEIVKNIESTLSPYKGMTEGDAQGWVSFDFYRAMRMSLGKWDWYQETLYNKILRKESVSTLDVIKFFPVEKMQYWGPLKTDGLNIMGFHKFSLMPLIPNVIQGTNLEILHNRMVQQNIDYAVFQSGSKVNTVTKDGVVDKFYVDNSKQSTNAVAFAEPDYRFTKNVIFLDYFKNQLETADQYKGKNIFSTQLRKLIEEGLMEQGVPTDFKVDLPIEERYALWNNPALPDEDRMTPNYEKLLNYENSVRALTDYKVRELKRELGFGNTEDITISENLVNFVKKELSRQDLAEHEIDFIRYNPVTKSLMYDLSIHPSAEKVEKLLTAVVYKRLVKQKVNGEPLIQVSGAGFEPAKLRAASDVDKELYGTNGLPFYRKGKAMKVKIALQGDFKKLLKHPDVIILTRAKGINALDALNTLLKDENWLSQGDNRRMVTIAGVRIPVQGFNSMEFAEVFEFLPESAGNIIIVPSEIVAKAGSDFDIDKLTMLFPSILKTRRGLELVKYDKSSEDIVNSVDMPSRLNELYKEKEEAYKKFQEFMKSFRDSVPLEIQKDYMDTLNDLNSNIKIFKDHILSYSIMGEEVPSSLYDDIQDYYEAIDEITELFTQPVKDYKKANLEPIDAEIERVKTIIAAGSSKGIENNLLSSVIDIMMLERNFADLITPNSTDILQPIAEDLSKYTRDYDPFMSLNGKEFTFTKGGKKKKRIAGTRVIEIGYNRFKHVSNNIGKKTLGLGAVDNTYNTLFNRIGFYLNPQAELGSGEYTYTVNQTLRMPHNVIPTKNGNAISLSNLYTKPDNDGKIYKISNLISQAMNGWVDVAKDAWVFDIQGNPELVSALLFMIQAGVQPKQAIYFISQPLIREYVKQRRRIRSAFAKPLGDSLTEYMMYKNKAKANILSGYDPNFMNMPLRRVNKYILTTTSQNLFLDTDYDPNMFSEEALYNRLKETAEAYNNGEYEPTIDDYRIFTHFVEIDEMANATTKIKLGINVDTAKTTNLFDTRLKLANILDLSQQPRFSSKMIEALENESPIGSFRVQETIINSISKLFKIRDNQNFVDFIRKVTPVMEDELHKQYPGAFKGISDFQSKLKNDFLNYVFQQWLYRKSRFNPYESYKGYDLKEVKEYEVTKAGLLKRGAFYDSKNKKLNVDFSTLKNQFNNKFFESENIWKEQRISPVSSSHFESGNSEVDFNQYLKFVYEREVLRDMIPFADYKQSSDYDFRVKELIASGLLDDQESKKLSLTELAGVRAYEDFLRDMALINKLNLSFMFKDASGLSAQLSSIDSMFPELKEKYSVFNIFSHKVYNGTYNISLNQTKLTSDEKSIYYDQIKALSDPNVQKVENKIDNDIISRVFSTLPIFSFVQSGMDVKSSYSLAPIIDTGLYERLILKSIQETKNVYSSAFLDTYMNLFRNQYTTVDELGERLSYRRKSFKNYFTNYAQASGPSFVSSTVYDPQIKTYNNGIYDYASFSKNLINAASKNPKLLFVYDDYLASYIPKDKVVPGTVTILKNKKKINTFNSSVIKDLAGKKLINPEQAVGIITKKTSTVLDDSDLITDATFEKNKQAIDARIKQIKDKVDQGYVPVFSRSGMGNALLGLGRRETFGDSGSEILKSPQALKTYLYLSSELYRHFGYINPHSKKYEEMVKLITEKQTITDEEVKEQLKNCFFK